MDLAKMSVTPRCLQSELERLNENIIRCRLCPRLAAWREYVARKKVRRFRSHEYWGRPVPGFGRSGARLIIVGLAPAAHGANRTGRMFTGDRSGEWLYEALHRFGFANRPDSRHRADGLALRNCYITAAVRCVPPQNKPARAELAECGQYLRREFSLLRSRRVVLALGQIAFGAVLTLERGGTNRQAGNRPPRFAHGAEWPMSRNAALIASYHPSQQNTQTGRLTREMFYQVFGRIRQILAE
ncbi:MAG: uracil-DNA glycosylase [Acidobacteriota bacterium]